VHPIKNNYTKLSRSRRCAGSSAEFAAIFAILICLILIPLLSAAFIPIRYYMCQGVITELVTRLAHSETRSDAYQTLRGDTRWKEFLAACETEARGTKLVLVATTANGGNKSISVEQGVSIPKEWLPDGSMAPCIYSLHLDCDCAISPLFGGPVGIAGVSAPVMLKVSSSAHWANLSRDPKSPTLAFYIDE
jgi:hypothetical protein